MWTWRCRAPDGSVLVASTECFPSLRAAVENAMLHGFRYAGRLPK
jgi:hypothetical protein